MKKIALLAGLLAICSYNSLAYDEYYDEDEIQQIVTSEVFGTVYNERPVRSYYAYPDDPNFIPETEFMDLDDDVDYDEMMDEVMAEEAEMYPGVSFAEKKVPQNPQTYFHTS